MFTRVQWAKDLCQALGNANPTQKILSFIVGWTCHETLTNSGAKFNLLNTTQPFEGAINFNSVGVKNFPNYQAGIQATINTILNGRYTVIAEILRDNQDNLISDENVASELHTWSGDINGYDGSDFLTLGTSHLNDHFDYGSSPNNHPITYTQPTDLQRSEAIDCWNSFFGELGHNPPPIDTGIFTSWLSFWINGKILGCPLTYEYKSHNWDGTSIVAQQFSHARCEWVNGVSHWYSLNGEITL